MRPRFAIPMRPVPGFLLMTALMFAAAPAFAGVRSDHSLALPDRFVQARLDGWVDMQAYDMAMPDTSAESEPRPVVDPVAAPAKKSGGMSRILKGTIVVLGIEALLAIPSTAAYADDDGKTLAAVDAGFAALSLINPSGTMGETIGSAVGVLGLAGAVLAIGDDTSKNELFLINWAGLNVAIIGGRWIGGMFDW